MVARQDNHAPGGWDDLLVQRTHREYVITGVIGKVLDKYVWEELLFGATEAQKDLLEKEDRLTADLDGKVFSPFLSLFCCLLELGRGYHSLPLSQT